MLLGGETVVYRFFGIPLMWKHKPGLTSAQLSEWECYSMMDPIGEWRKDFHMASIMSTITNSVRSVYGKKGIKMTIPMDFMPNWNDEGEFKEPERGQSVEEMKSILMSIAASQNKKFEDKTKK